MVNRKKKYASGEGAQFISRRSALKKLQLSLNNFRRLCIIKGIYPREPRNRKRAQKGSTAIKTLYHIKDIQFLLHEPIVWKFRDYKIFNKKVSRARSIKDFEAMRTYLSNHPTIKLDHIVKERYPTFIDAIKDLDDCLTLCFLFSTFPSLAHVPREQSDMCRRLTVEFMHYVIEARALRKVFISIKGYYYQAEIKGQTVTWIVPHHFSFEPQSKADVDFKVMSTFVEFYVVMLGFVNFRLYNTLNLYYPPKFAALESADAEKSLVDEEVFVAERVAALNCNISRMHDNHEEEVTIDNFGDDPEQVEELKRQAEELKTLKSLFTGLKFFLNREVPREPLVFVIRCFGGEVSWDKSLFVGSTFDETDETITHQIVDRPSLEKQYISRYYVQPQWLIDSINARQLLSVNKYFIGEVLPPHLSPFVDKDRDQSYIPPEEQALYDPTLLEKMHKDDAEEDVDSEENEEEKKDQSPKEDDDADSNEEDEDETPTPKKNLSVKTGEIETEVPWANKLQDKAEYKLREKMIKGRHRKLYKSMMQGRQDRAKESWLLKKKRRIHDEKAKEEKKVKAKGEKKKIATK